MSQQELPLSGLSQLSNPSEFPHSKLLNFYNDLSERYTRLEEQLLRDKRYYRKLILEMQAENLALRQEKLFKEEALAILMRQRFASSSERMEPLNQAENSPATNEEGDNSGTSDSAPKQSKKRAPSPKRPSERYPNIEVVIVDVVNKEPSTCSCCSSPMQDSGMTEDTEYLHVVPKTFQIIRQKRMKETCAKCHGAVVTAANPPRITPGGVLGDSMIIDIAAAKYGELMPIQRYVKIAEQAGLKGFPEQTAINGTHCLADFCNDIYLKVRDEVLSSRILHADETPHKMLEGDERKNWYLWGFSSKTAAYFEIEDTRSGDVGATFLKKSQCEALMSDVFSGYNKAIRITNEKRETEGKVAIKQFYCNAHARRKFKTSFDLFGDIAKPFLADYQVIYKLSEDRQKITDPPTYREHVDRIRKIFERMRTYGTEILGGISDKSELAKAIRYFIGNFEGFTAYLEHPDYPIDNNPQERLLRNPVIGRKTWYGTHSVKGSETAAVLFTIVESCKLNEVDPRFYLRTQVARKHSGLEMQTPSDFAKLLVVAEP